MRKYKDYLTGKYKIAGPEEPNRQWMLKRLHEDYGYPKSLMREEFGFKRSPSDYRRSVPADIAVFENHQDIKMHRPKIIVETKKPNLRIGKSQLEDYMSLDFRSNVYGIWYNGYDTKGKSKNTQPIFFLEKSLKPNGEPQFHEVLNVPHYGVEKNDDLILKKGLHKSRNLKSIFSDIRGYIVANARGITQDKTILQQMAMVIISKLYDEKYNNSKYARFRVYHNEDGHVSDRITAENIHSLFDDAADTWDDVFSDNDKLVLDDKTLTHIVAQLEYYSLRWSSRNVISDAFENIITYATKGTQGQFFTPLNVSRLMVAVAHPSENDAVLDPASGTAQFLIDTMLYVWNRLDKEKKNLDKPALDDLKDKYVARYIFGIDKDKGLVKAAKAYMAMLGDGRTGLYCENSLDLNSWKPATKNAIRGRKFNIILSNPPFGKNIRVSKAIRQRYSYKYGSKIELAFVELSLRMLARGGLLGIILPETYFHSSAKANVRRDLFYNNDIVAMVDLPHATFQPYNNAKTDIIFLRKGIAQQDYIKMINLRSIGHTHNGHTKYKIDSTTDRVTNVVDDDATAVTKDIVKGKTCPLIKKIPAKIVKRRNILVPRYYFSNLKASSEYTSLGWLVKHNIVEESSGDGSPRSEMKGLGSFPYVRVKDVVNLEIAHNRLDDIPKMEYKRLKKVNICPTDIVMVRRGSYRIGDVGMIFPKDTHSLLAHELTIFRVKKNDIGLTSFNLLAMLNSHFVRRQFPNLIFMDTTLPNLADRWKDIELNLRNKKHLQKLDKIMRNMYSLRNKYWINYNRVFRKC